MIDVNKILFRASANGKIMTNDRSGNAMGETAKSYLKQLYREIKYKRRQEITTKYMEKGLAEEEAAITLYSLYKKKFFTKNDEWLTNDFLSGTPDIFSGVDIRKTEEGADTKCSWSLWTFPFADEKLSGDYYWQNITYMALTGAKRWTTAFCLVNASASLIDAEKKRIYYSLGCPDDDNVDYHKKCISIEKNMIFDLLQFKKDNPHYDMACNNWEFDIPMSERVVEFTVDRNESEIEALYERIKLCRVWMENNLFLKK